MNAKSKTIAKPKPIQEDDFLTIPEIAFLLRSPNRLTGDLEPLKRGSVEQLRVRYRGATEPTEQAKALPEPDGFLGSVPYWRLARITTWADGLGRKYAVEEWRAKRDAGGFRRHQDLI